jgi:hypothetical protein
VTRPSPWPDGAPTGGRGRPCSISPSCSRRARRRREATCGAGATGPLTPHPSLRHHHQPPTPQPNLSRPGHRPTPRTGVRLSEQPPPTCDFVPSPPLPSPDAAPTPRSRPARNSCPNH